MAANYNLIVVHGPPSPETPQILKKRLPDMEKYKHVYPSQLFDDHPSFGVRDIANHVLGLLRKHKKVVVEESSAGGAVKDCLLKVIPNKLPACSLQVVSVVPRHGQLQTQWERQFLLAACAQRHRLLSDDQLLQWFDDQGHVVQSSPVSTVARPGLHETVTVELTAASCYKLEVPGLLVQWESVLDSGRYLQERMTTACQQWTHTNPCGRLVLFCDGHAVAKGHLSAAEQQSQIIQCSKALASELPCPVYVVQLTSVLGAGDFSVPPNPGLLAFLQQRHHLDLHHKNSVYIYNDVRHMKMAERAGIRHIKDGKVLKNPQQMRSCHGISTACPIPPMLRQIQLVCDTEENTTPPASIPLADHVDEFDDGHICLDHSRFLREFVFARDMQLLLSYQKRYAELASRVGETGSRLTSQPTHTKPQHSPAPTVSGEGVSLLEQTSETAPRQIPKWMLGRRGSSDCMSTQVSLEKSSSSSSVEGKSRSRHILYVMTEKELLETAREVLKQAGKEDIIQMSALRSLDSPNKDNAKKDTEPEATSHLAPSTSKDAKTIAIDDQSTLLCELNRDPVTPVKKQRLSSPSERDQLQGATTDNEQNLQELHTQVQTTAGQGEQAKMRMKPHARKQAPDLSVLDEIFS